MRLDTGEVLQKRDLPEQYFGEGIVVCRDELFQLTCKSEIGFVYDRDTFAPKRTFRYPGEGWGLTHDGTNLVMSDGTDRLRFLDPSSLKEIRRMPVTAGGTAGEEPERARVGQGRDLRQHLDDRLRRADRPGDRPRHRLGRSYAGC